MAPPRLVLASTSPRRADLLSGLGLDFEIVPSRVNETYPSGLPHDFAVAMAREKALEVARRLGDPRRVVLGADTIVVLESEVLGKPRDAEDAHRMLRWLSGREHSVITGFCLVRPPAEVLHEEGVETRVTFREVGPAQIARYVATGEPLDKAGAYAAQGIGMFLIRAVRGSYSNVVGLPVCEVVEALECLGVVPDFPPTENGA